MPAVVDGMLVYNDFLIYRSWHRCFSEQLIAGEWYPRWLTGMNAGSGSPAFFFYPPLPYYVSAFFAFLVPENPQGSLALYLSLGLSLGLSGLTCFVMLRNYASDGNAFIWSLFYMLAPYHLFVSMYYRFAYAESWAFAWVPLTVHCLIRVLKGEEGYRYGLCLSYALLIITHLPSVLITTPFLVLFVLFNRPKARMAIKLLLTLAASYLLTAIYVLPMLLYQKHVSLDILWEGKYSIFNNMLGAMSLFDDEYFFKLAIVNILTMLLIFLSVKKPLDKTGLFWIVSGGLSLFMMFKVSAVIWWAMPLLHKIQFPSRLNLVTLLAIVVLLATIAGQDKKGKTPTAYVIKYLLIGLVIVQVLSVFLQIASFRKLVLSEEQAQKVVHESIYRDGVIEYLPRGVSDEIRTLVLGNGIEHADSFVSVSGDGELKITGRAPREIRLESLADSEYTAIVRQFYFPYLELIAEDGTRQADVTADRDGYIRLTMPPGQHRLSLRLADGPPERLGKWISLFSLVAFLALVARRRFRGRKFPGPILGQAPG